MFSPSNNYQADVVEAFNDDFLNIDNRYFVQMVSQIYSTDLQLMVNISDTESLFWT